ncbi:MAG: hypothetical protein EPO06_08685 [Burkholderiaceae bacterium]|nr:MAG: hypothetical protein EPO06_08685 [Burkholderiaceae bacterium]
MTAEILTLRQVPVEPPPAFSAAVNVDLLQKIRMAPVPVLFLCASEEADWQGFCSSPEFTERREIVLDSKLVEPSIHQPQPRRIVHVYLHECAHRLMPDHDHDTAFFCLSLLLHLRAGKIGRHMWFAASLYDIHDDVEFETPELFLKRFDWAWRLATSLAESERTAEECATLIHQKYPKFCEWLGAVPAREEAAQRRCEEAALHLKNLQSALDSARADRLLFFVFGAVVGLLLLATFFL